MKTLYWISAIIILAVFGYFAFYLGWALMKIFIGLGVIALLVLGFYIGRITKKNEK